MATCHGDVMGQTEIVIADVLVAVAGLSALASRLTVPYPIVLVAGRLRVNLSEPLVQRANSPG
jgi:hypothetical protein